MQAGAYQNGTWVVGVAKGGVEEGVDSLASRAIIAPSGQIVAQALQTDDELVAAAATSTGAARYKGTLFDFDRYRRPEVYARITSQRGARRDRVAGRPCPERRPGGWRWPAAAFGARRLGGRCGPRRRGRCRRRGALG
jgi:hypothetical protein